MTLDDIAHHVRAVRRGASEATILADLPYATYDTPEAAVASARHLVEAGADMVKFEGARPDVARALAAAGIAASGHLGLECQHHDERRVKARTAAAARQLETDAVTLGAAGIALLVLELIPEEVATRITQAVAAATIGIGAGRGTNGQVLVIHDILGLTKVGYRHNRRFAELGTVMRDAAGAFAVRGARRKFSGSGERVLDAQGRAGVDREQGLRHGLSYRGAHRANPEPIARSGERPRQPQWVPGSASPPRNDARSPCRHLEFEPDFFSRLLVP